MKKVALFTVLLMLSVSLSGCLGGGRGKGDGNSGNMGSPEEVKADEYNVLYVGHSFGRTFAITLQDVAHASGFEDHAQYIEMSGGASGAD